MALGPCLGRDYGVPVQVQVLGVTRCRDEDGQERDLGARKPRSVLAALALLRDQDVSAERLADLVWGGNPPASAHGTLHSYLSVLRRSLPEPSDSHGSALTTTDLGYRLRLPAADVDADAFADLVGRTRRTLAPLESQLRPGERGDWPEAAEVARAVQALEDALGSWNGLAYGDLPEHPDVDSARAALAEWRTTAELDRALGLLALGDHAGCLAVTELLTARRQLRERTWSLHALALARSGRIADALGALRAARELLVEELGVDPGAEAEALEQALLRRDPLPEPLSLPVTGATSAAPGPSEPVTGREPVVVAGWPTLGRDAEIDLLRRSLDETAGGALRVVQLVGDAGIGKSRLVAETVAAAEAGGMVTGVGLCSQDAGAPPMWPWRAVLAGLAEQAAARGAREWQPPPAPWQEGRDLSAEEAFTAWGVLTDSLAELASQHPVLLVLDDLHWADTATLQSLRHVIGSLPEASRVLVLLARRPIPEPADLGAVLEAAARRHTTRVELTGLSDAASQELLGEVAVDGLTPEAGRRWSSRAGGNPYFLIELARLADRAATSDAVPGTVLDVVRRRVAVLPDDTRRLLVTAAVIGPTFPVDLLAAVDEIEVDDADETLQPARDAGLLTDLDDTMTGFAHALARDALLVDLSRASRRRLHAHVAHALEQGSTTAYDADQVVGELAQHWSHAGPAHAGRTWRAAGAAAALARRRFARVEASAWMQRAVDAHRQDPAGTPEERFDLLLTTISDRQGEGQWTALPPLLAQATAIAREAGDPARVAAAAMAVTRDSVWQPLDWFTVDEDVVDDLRWALAELPEELSVDRCRAMLGLAVQLYYSPTAVAEIVALVDEGVAMARRLDDPTMLWMALRAAIHALWRPSHDDKREPLIPEALEAARRTGEPDAETVALVICAGEALVRADRSSFEEFIVPAQELAARRQHSFALVAINWMLQSLAAMRGDQVASEAHTAALLALQPPSTHEVYELLKRAIRLVTGLWSDDVPDRLEAALALNESTIKTFGLDAMWMALTRAGAEEMLRDAMRTHIHPPVECWNAAGAWACIAEAAAATDHKAEAAHALDGLAHSSGGMAIMGYSVHYGPTDGYRALALATLGRSDEARVAADAAKEVAQEWDLSRYLVWLDGWRRRLQI